MAKYPAIPTPRPGDIRSHDATLLAIKQTLDILTGVSHRTPNTVVTVGALVTDVTSVADSLTGDAGAVGERGPLGIGIEGDEGQPERDVYYENCGADPATCPDRPRPALSGTAPGGTVSRVPRYCKLPGRPAR